MKKIRILIVDDENVIRDGVATILSLHSDFEVVGQASDGLSGLEIAKKTKPDVILLDMKMPRQDGLSTIPKLKEHLPDSKILVLTSFTDSNVVYQSIKAGALGYLLKDSTREQLIQGIHDVAAGLATIHPSIAIKVIHEIDHPKELLYTSEPLTRREIETLRLISRGLTNYEISEKLSVNERTIAKYVSSILNKLHLANRTQAALYAIKEGLAGPQN
jgi:NarL family two-component system response regulator LiaR